MVSIVIQWVSLNLELGVGCLVIHLKLTQFDNLFKFHAWNIKNSILLTFQFLISFLSNI